MDIEKLLSIPSPTLSGWLKHIKLTELQKTKLRIKHNQALIKARVGAVNWHHKQKLNRLVIAEKEADHTLSLIGENYPIVELALALLYLGEGFKKKAGTGIGNSDPLILKFFLKVIMNIYNVDKNRIRLHLHLRADQNQEKIKMFWATELNVPLERFGKTSVDKRTIRTSTYPGYMGVCVIDCGNVAIQRKLVYIARKFCEKFIQNTRD